MGNVALPSAGAGVGKPGGNGGAVEFDTGKDAFRLGTTGVEVGADVVTFPCGDGGTVALP